MLGRQLLLKTKTKNENLFLDSIEKSERKFTVSLALRP